MPKPLRLAVLGLGPMGKDLFEQAVKHPQVQVTALCDVDPELPKAVLAGQGNNDIRVFTKLDELLAWGEVDSVINAVPQYLHASTTIQALKAGLHVFCEKPMALNVRECQQMIDAAAGAGKVLMVGQVLRYINVYRWLLDEVRSGNLGRPFAMRTIRTMGRWGSWARPWRMRKDQTGGFLLEVNVHEIDLMRCVLGDATSVSAVGKRFTNGEADYEDWVTAHVTFTNGGLGSITSSVCDHIGRNSGEVFCEEGTIYFDSVTQTARLGRPGHEPVVLSYNEIGQDWEHPVYREVREFVESCLGEAAVSIPGEDGLKAVEIGEAAYRSITEQGPVSLPLSRS